ncbi:MAG: esterase [Elusimicrobia bacterium]|nr:esterase [Elusimicrobiota bacterium]
MRRLLSALLLAAVPARAGFERGALEHGGLKRTYALYVPARRPAHPAAVFVLHGGGGTGAQLRRHTRRRFEALADKDGFVVVYPDGVDRHWDDGRDLPGRSVRVDDLGFLAELADRLTASLSLDPARLYVTGISNGGFMANALACGQAGRWAAVAPVAASLGEKTAAACRPSRAVPVLMVNGTEDPLVPWDGREVRFLGRSRGRKLTVPETAARWAALDGCAKDPAVTELPPRDPSDPTRVELRAWRGGRRGAEVLLYRVVGGGHTWPGGRVYLPRLVGPTTRQLDVEALIWSFFARHPLPRDKD